VLGGSNAVCTNTACYFAYVRVYFRERNQLSVATCYDNHKWICLFWFGVGSTVQWKKYHGFALAACILGGKVTKNIIVYATHIMQHWLLALHLQSIGLVPSYITLAHSEEPQHMVSRSG
jgi:hypothetical protein